MLQYKFTELWHFELRPNLSSVSHVARQNDVLTSRAR